MECPGEETIDIVVRLQLDGRNILLNHSNVELKIAKRMTYEQLCSKIVKGEIETDWKHCSSYQIVCGYAASSRTDKDPVKGPPTTNILAQALKFNFLYYSFVLKHEENCACTLPEPETLKKNAFQIMMSASANSAF